MTNILKLLFIGVVLTLPSHAEINPKKLTVDGTFLGIYNSIQERQTQFDFASNINFNYELSPQLNGTIQFQSSPGNGSLGFVGPSVNLTDAALTY
ncbi:MAG: hypothetical protein VW397_07575, partial [Candidatus Margulisiibacteriota bacterium]